MRKILAVLVAAAAAILGWGYWHAATHGVLHVALNDVSLRNERQLYGSVTSAELVLADAAGRMLASAHADVPLGVVSVRHPTVGDCRSAERGAGWQECFETQSRWLRTWVREARFASVKLANCEIDRVPVSLEERNQEWWLWWVPLVHVGGKPYTYFNLTLWVDSRNCRPAAAPR